MSAEWKPGDVVAATVNGRPNVRVIAGWSKYDPQLRWGELSPRWADGDDDECWFMPSQVTDHRPLVVIDPEDAEQVERLRASLQGMSFSPWACGAATCLTHALRGFANPTPPKPDEPQGLGAVVEDAEGADWHRTRDGRWIAEDGLRSRAAGWVHIDAVRVLSEGVTA